MENRRTLPAVRASAKRALECEPPEGLLPVEKAYLEQTLADLIEAAEKALNAPGEQ